MIRKSILCGAACLAFTASARATVLFSDTFSYPDGQLDNDSNPTTPPTAFNPTSPWNETSRPEGQIQVTSGEVNLTSAGSEAVAAALNTSVGGAMVYAGYDVNFSSLPTTTTFNAAFAGLSVADSGLQHYVGRLFAEPASDAPTTSFQIGVADTSATQSGAAYIPIDLSLNTTYRIVEGYNGSTGHTTIYLNPTSETGGTTAIDAANIRTIGASDLLDDSGIGTLQLDNLVVGTTFADVASVPEPTSLTLLGLGGLALVRRRRA